MKTIFIFIFSFVIILGVAGQDSIVENPQPKQKKAISEKLFYGGTIGVSFGDYSRIAIYPYLGLRITKKFRMALQIGYEYISDSRSSTKYTASNYGLSVWAQYNIIPALYLHLEPAYYSYETYYIEGENRVWVPFVFAGAGLQKKLGARTAVYAQVKFDLLQDENSPYKNWDPFFDIGIVVGI